MAVDYLKTYLGIDPNDYSAMESRIRGDEGDEGDEPQALSPFMMRQPMMMPQQRSLGDIEAMPMLPRSQPAQQDDSKYNDLMAQIASLKAQIDALQTPVAEEAPMMPVEPEVAEALPKFLNPDGTPMTASTGQEAFYNDDGTRKTFQAPVGIENRAVGEPEPIAQREQAIQQAPSQDIQASIDMLASLPKMNIPQIPDMEEIKRKMAEANMSFPEPVSYQDQLQSIRDIPSMNQMPSREQIQMAMQNIPTPMPEPMVLPNIPKFSSPAPQMPSREQIQMAMQNIPTPVAPVSSMPRFNLPQMQSFGSPRQATGELNIDQGYRPQFRAAGGSLDMALQDLKSKLNG